MVTSALHTLPAAQILRAIHARELSSVEATRYFIERIERHDGTVNAVPVRDFERALQAAQAADAALAAGAAPGPLHGLPMTVKESFFVAGLPVTHGDPARRGNIAAADSQLIGRVRGAGAVILGKSNVPLMTADWQSYNAIHGTTHNPWRHGRTPGGSSGGSAAALAQGLTPLELGSDRAGSIRIPAAFCGVLGHRPTWGILPGLGDALHGDVSPSDIGTAGPMAYDAGDLDLFLRVLARQDPGEGVPWRLELPEPKSARLADYRFAVWTGDPAVRTSAEVSGRLQAVMDGLAQRGIAVRAFEPFFDTTQAREVGSALRVAAVIAGKSRDMLEQYRQVLEQPAQAGTVRLRHARAALASYHAWAQANEWRNRLRRQWRAFFQDVDILLCPITVRDAFPQDETGTPEMRRVEVDGVDCDYYDQEFWPGVVATCYLPSTVMPVGMSRDGLPLAMQVVGAEGRDLDTIRAVTLLQQALGLSVPRPAP